MGRLRRAKCSTISCGSLCCVRDYYAFDYETESQLGIVIGLQKNEFEVRLYVVLLKEEIVLRNDLEVRLVDSLQFDE